MWFRPARNRKHPGDAPPRWAPLGRYGRVVIIATVITGVIIALALTGTRPADAVGASSPSAIAPGAADLRDGGVRFVVDADHSRSSTMTGISRGAALRS